MTYEIAETNKEDEKKRNLKCWHTKCNKIAIIENRGGWKWCWKHYWWQRDGYFSKMRKIIWSNLLKL